VITLSEISLDNINDLSNPNTDFMNALNSALGGSSENQIYNVSFSDNGNGGVDVTYAINMDLAPSVSISGFGNMLLNSIENEPGLAPLFGIDSKVLFLIPRSKRFFDFGPFYIERAILIDTSK
jgi:hypothetical protein